MFTWLSNSGLSSPSCFLDVFKFLCCRFVVYGKPLLTLFPTDFQRQFSPTFICCQVLTCLSFSNCRCSIMSNFSFCHNVINDHPLNYSDFFIDFRKFFYSCLLQNCHMFERVYRQVFTEYLSSKQRSPRFKVYSLFTVLKGHPPAPIYTYIIWNYPMVSIQLKYKWPTCIYSWNSRNLEHVQYTKKWHRNILYIYILTMQ